MKISASGKKNGKKLSVEVVQLEEGYYDIKFNDAYNADLETEILGKMADHPKMAGTFYPESESGKLFAIIAEDFFDVPPDDFEAEGVDLNMPSEKGVIY